jgi:hypothetical protein
MKTLSDIVGALMTDMVNARRIADEHTVRVAQLYKKEPLLSGMSVPRIRIPEITIEMPIVVKMGEGAQEEKNTPPQDVVNRARKFLTKKQKKENLDFLSSEFIGEFCSEFKSRLDDIVSRRGGAIAMRTAFANEAGNVLNELLDKLDTTPSKAITDKLYNELENEIYWVAVKKEAKPSSINIHAETEKVKTRTDPKNATRIRIVMKEEGMEWHEVKTDAGPAQRLAPE